MTDAHKLDGVEDSQVRKLTGLQFQFEEIYPAWTLISNKWLHRGAIITVQPPVSNHPKCEALVVT